MSVIQTVEFKNLKAKFVFYTILPVLNNTYVQDSRKYDSTSPLAQLTSNNTMGLLPNASNCGCACAGNVFPATVGKQSRHASRHVRDARAVMHAGDR